MNIHDTTEDRLILEKLIEISKEFIIFTEGTPDYKRILRVMLEISGAKYASFNIFDNNGLDFTTVSFIAESNIIFNVIDFLGFDIVNKHWRHDPSREEKIKTNTITRYEWLHDLTGNVLKKSIVSIIEKTFNVKETFVVKVIKENKTIGDFTLMFSKGETLKNESIVDLYTHMVGMFMDRNKITTNLSKSEKRHNSMISNISDVIGILDVNGVFKYLSPNIEKWFGWKQNDLLEKECWFTVHPNDIKRIHIDFTNLLKEDSSTKTVEFKLLCSDGSYRPIELTASNLVKDTIINGVLINYRDLTERKKEDFRREQQFVFTKALNEIAEVIITHENSEEILQNANRIIGETLQLDRALIYDVSFEKKHISALCEWLKAIHPDIEATKGEYPIEMFLHPLMEILRTQRYLESQDNAVGEYFSKDNSGELLHKNFKIKSLIWYPFAFYKDGYYLFTLNQILENRIWTKEEISFIESAARQVSLALMKINLLGDRIRKEEELKTAKEKAEENDRLKSAFLANMSHEIRTPMNGILGFSQLLKEPELSSENQQMYISIIEKSGSRMLNIIDEIVDISKIESGQMDLNYQETNISELLETLYYFLKPEAIKKGIEMSIKNRWHAGEANIKTDKEKLYAIVSNLVKNAIKYTDKGTIEFGVKLRSSELEFFVKDTGIGIPVGRQLAIFDRFVQSDISDINARQGAGLGLSISKSFVEMLGGKIWVESEEGKGSAFYFTLPFPEGNEEKIDKKNSKWTEENDFQFKNLKILIADDDESSAELLTIFLKKYSKEIIIVTTGLETVETCMENKDFDLIFMDIQMPEMDGYEAARQIRKFNKKVIIIAQTAFALSGDMEKAILAGCNDYISKPINSNLLKKLIAKNFNKMRNEK